MELAGALEVIRPNHLLWEWFAAHFTDESSKWQDGGGGEIGSFHFAAVPLSIGNFGFRCPWRKRRILGFGEQQLLLCSQRPRGQFPGRDRMDSKRVPVGLSFLLR